MNLREIADRAASRARAAVAGRQARRHGLVGRPELWQQKRDFQIAFLREHGLLPAHVLVDLGCGTLRGGIPIIAYLDEVVLGTRAKSKRAVRTGELVHQGGT